MIFCRLQIFSSKFTFSKNSFKNTIRMSNKLELDQDQRFVGPDLATYCLQKLPARVNLWKLEQPLSCQYFLSAFYTCFIIIYQVYFRLDLSGKQTLWTTIRLLP